MSGFPRCVARSGEVSPPSAQPPGERHMAMADEVEPLVDVEELSEDEDVFEVEELDEEGLPAEGEEDEEEDDINDLNKLIAQAKETKEAEEEAGRARGLPEASERPAVVDDFIRNFLMKFNMKETLEAFQSEWYELQEAGKLADSEGALVVPDVYVTQQTMADEIRSLKTELSQTRAIAAKAKSGWDKFRKERDFHRMHHRRVVQEKNKLITDLRRLKKHYDQYEPTLHELKTRYESVMKEKMLLRLERDRLLGKVDTLQRQTTKKSEAGEVGAGATTATGAAETSLQQPSTSTAPQARLKGGPSQTEGVSTEESRKRRPQLQDTPWPADERQRRGVGGMQVTVTSTATTGPAVDAARLKLHRTFKGHMAAIAAVAFHPKMPLVATASDDRTWKTWSMPGGELVMSGEGHRDWLSGVVFHPRGSRLISTSGDGTAKVWDFVKERCVHTFKDHSSAVWGCDVHCGGDFLVTAGMDHTARVFDLNSHRCRQTLRGHVDAVNSAKFQPQSAIICTASGDKTVSLWDMRSGLCVQTFYGHSNACNHATLNSQGAVVASSDADGIVKLWDVRKIAEILQIDTGRYPANAAAYDPSGNTLAIASGDASIKLFDVEQQAFVSNLEGHEDAVQDVVFDPRGSMLVSASSDASFRVWQP
ncbi:unnamed protein product [Vitrella brassicaformis CCMP3155]|uniref:Uncharacterized protein n=2 Tax=Vitrella brassicaformis TaxID=1169539 RepID=A0A0G4F4H1_VITBC|nr:unnamed protein product [Vitrella brassicaformis CCMP3155]|eukprot:CEM06778.1 unnamed protein product [Vitrella brassicaformis CCMP3155]